MTPVAAALGLAILAALPVEEEVRRMTPASWIFMLSSLTFVWVLTIWCFRRVLRAPESTDAIEDFHSA